MLALPRLPAGTLVLRSLGKFFGLAGLRVGFVVVPEPEAADWRDLLGDWPVSGPACEIARLALGDSAWIAATRLRLSEDRKRLDAMDAGSCYGISNHAFSRNTVSTTAYTRTHLEAICS